MLESYLSIGNQTCVTKYDKINEAKIAVSTVRCKQMSSYWTHTSHLTTASWWPLAKWDFSAAQKQIWPGLVLLLFNCTLSANRLYRAIAVWNTLWFKKNAPTLADYNYDPVQSILIIFSKLFANDHKSCLVVKFSTSPHICCHYLLWNNALFCTNYTAYRKKCANFGSP